MVRNLVILLAIAGAGYWYWSNRGPDDRQTAELKQLDENNQRMQHCVTREESMNAAAGMGGVGSIATNAKELCAEKLGLYFAEGQWRRLDDGTEQDSY